jgi:hypothetical protein
VPLPAKIRNAFRLGIDLAARLPEPREGCFAWLWVQPIMKSGKTHAQVLNEWSLTGEASGPYDDTVARYLVRYVELTNWHIAQGYEMDWAMGQRPVTDIRIEVEDEGQLVEVLGRWLADLHELRATNIADYPYPPLRTR